MDVEKIKTYCLSKPKACETYPFGDVPICYKLNNKIFAQLYPYELDYKITLKCTADAGDFYRMMYPGKVVRGYHCPPVQQPYWNTVYLDDFPEEELLNMIDLAYETVLQSFSKKVQAEIRAEGEIITRITRMEQYLDELLTAWKDRPDTISIDTSLQEKIQVLKDYYDSGQWLRDYECDERGELPADLKRGVLAQDTLYELFSMMDHFESVVCLTRKMSRKRLEICKSSCFERFYMGTQKSCVQNQHTPILEVGQMMVLSKTRI